jgi:polyhydroxyalkanoate synthesis regulator phasin
VAPGGPGLSKDIVVRLRVPGWIDEERVKKNIHVFIDELINSGEQTADEARRFYGVKETNYRIDVPPNMERKILDTRKKVSDKEHQSR